jgi:hypothetical protein
MISKEQARYIMKVYPKTVSQEEAEEEYKKANVNGADQSYWQKMANAINAMAK